MYSYHHSFRLEGLGTAALRPRYNGHGVIPYQTKTTTLAGTSYSEVYRVARRCCSDIAHTTRRKPYVRSAYFRKEKVFLDLFWSHLHAKTPRDRFRRLKYYAAALDLLRHGRNPPAAKPNPNRLGEVLHRFAGLTKDRELFFVQVKESVRTHRKDFLSCFPAE